MLSADSDFFRYIVPGRWGEMPPYAVYSDYHVAKDGLLLQPHQKPKKKAGVQARPIMSPPPPSEANDPGKGNNPMARKSQKINSGCSRQLFTFHTSTLWRRDGDDPNTKKDRRTQSLSPTPPNPKLKGW